MKARVAKGQGGKCRGGGGQGGKCASGQSPDALRAKSTKHLPRLESFVRRIYIVDRMGEGEEVTID